MLRLLLTLVLIHVAPAALWANGVALVIGNANYANVSELDNPGNDARAVSAALQAQGFDVQTHIDLGRTQMRNALRAFRKKADGADVALVYYAGHGIEIAGENYLVPVDARLEDERDAGLEMVEVDLILRQISGAKTLKMVVLDACRNNPFVVKMQRENAGRNVGNGLGRVDFTAPDTLIAYAAAAGEITPDGQPGGNSPFTRAFVNAMAGPPADVRRLLGRARDELRRSVPGAAPFVYTSLGGSEMVINPLPGVPDPVPAQGAQNASISEDFVQVDRAGTLTDWNAFLVRWKNQSDHPLYAFALQKRESLKPTSASRGETATPKETSAATPAAQATSFVPVAIPTMTRDEALRAVQQGLKDRNCYRGAIDGILGRGSQRGLLNLSNVIGKDLELLSDASLKRIDQVLTILDDHPDAACPAPVVRQTPSKPKTSPTRQKTTSPTPVKTAPKAEPKSKTSQGSSSYSRQDSTKLPPVRPSDCVGSRKKFYDCP